VLLNQRGQVPAQAVLVAVGTLVAVVATSVAVVATSAAGVSGALLEAALGLRQLSTVAAFEEHRLSRVHTLAAEVSADQVLHLDSIMEAVA
jgi:hypothetical protein